MQSWRFGAGLLLTVVACAVQNNPLPEDGGDDDDVGGTSAGGKASSAGKSAGGVPTSSGSSQGGKSGDGSGGDFGDQEGGKGGTSSGGAAGKTSGGSATGGGGAGTSGSGGKGGSTSGGTSSGGGGSTSGGVSGGGSGGGGTSSGGGGGGSCMPLNAGNLAGISARYEKEGNDDYALAGKLIIANTGPNTLNLADLKLRYYFTNEVTAALQKTINWCYYRPNGGGAQEDRTGKVSFDVVPMACKPTGADTYLEFKFTADAGLLEPGKQIYFSWAVHNSASQKFTKTNDYSYDASATEGNDFNKVVVLQNSGSKIWGTEP
ncbi:MAG TPA: cellulose binding domain-containing protein [Polyangiaceae bacterium]|nr:cellulose binding domain-containing protein [Polyangiaceae bacterium]